MSRTTAQKSKNPERGIYSEIAREVGVNRSTVYRAVQNGNRRYLRLYLAKKREALKLVQEYNNAH